jgi:hypothetical protein
MPSRRNWAQLLVIACVSQALSHTSLAADAPVLSAAESKAPGAPAQSPQLKEALDGFAKSIAAMRGYDVYLTVTFEFPMKSVIVDQKDPSHPNITKSFEWRPWEPGESPKKDTRRFRQVQTRDGKRRIEKEATDSDAYGRGKFLIVDDGKKMRILNGDDRGSIRKSGDFRLQRGDEYSSYFGNLMGIMQVLDVIRERPDTCLIEEANANADLVGILLPARGGPSLQPFEFRLWLDRRHGFLPMKIEAYSRRGAEPLLEDEAIVTEFHEAKQGVWAPVAMTYTSFNLHPGPYQGKPVNVYHVVVDVNRSRWGVELKDDLFELAYPPGAAIVDSTAQNARVAPPRERLDLSKVREQDRAAAQALLKYEADLKINQEGAITKVIVQVDSRFEGGLAGPNLDDAGLAYVGKLADLEELNLAGTQITDEGLSSLAGLAQLKVLVLENTNVSDAGLQHLSGLTNLRRLYLDNNRISPDRTVERKVRITDLGLVHLKGLTKLEQLLLRGTEISDAGLLQLTGLSNLKYVALGRTAVTPDGVDVLKAAIPNLEFSLR